MKQISKLGAALAVLTLGAVVAAAQEMPPMPQPTVEHQRLTEDVGEWHAALKIWMGPGEPMLSEGKETVSMVGPFWQVAKFESQFMGQPFTGMGLMGWDAEKKEFVSSWVDSMTPTISHGSVTWDAATKSFRGSMTGMGPDGAPQIMETVIAYPEEGKRIFTTKVGGQTTMEITYTRK